MKKSIAIFVLIFTVLACNKKIENPYSPEPLPPPPPLPQATISIGSNPSPILFYWNAQTLRYEGSYTIVVSEINGVGCNISTVEAAFYYNNQTYAPATLQGRYLSANNRTSFMFMGWTAIMFPQIRILVKGQDDNGYQIDKSAFFNVVYYYP